MAKSAKSTSSFDFTNIIPEKTAKKSASVSAVSSAPKKGGVTEGGIKRNYYLPEDIIKAINLKSAEEGISKNELVQEALRVYLKDYLKK
ncbi:MAG: CopG family transcriptional regulator [Acutalibacteraceae bacterium]|nr:CopG family transcriptional regulator [Acutalibacteraceae bacterium]